MEQKDCWLKNDCNRCDCDSYCLRFFKLDTFYKQSLLTDKQRNNIKLRLDANLNDKEAFVRLKEIESNIIEYVKEGKNLLIHSTIAGNGKTSWAIKMAQAYLNKIWLNTNLDAVPVLFISVPKYLLMIKENINNKSDYIQHIKNNVLEATIVIWDDIGTKASTQFEHDNLFSIIDNRINNGKTNIFTSNLSNEELHNALGDRLHSRIVNMSNDNIELVGSDKRNLTII